MYGFLNYKPLKDKYLKNIEKINDIDNNNTNLLENNY